MLLNLVKTKVLVFNKPVVSYIFLYNGNEIERCNEYKYLGTCIWFNTAKHNCVGNAQEYLVSQSRKTLFQAYKLSNPTVGKLTPLLAFKVFDSQILPILEYRAEILYKGKPVDIMERFHMQFFKAHS